MPRYSTRTRLFPPNGITTYSRPFMTYAAGDPFAPPIPCPHPRHVHTMCPVRAFCASISAVSFPHKSRSPATTEPLSTVCASLVCYAIFPVVVSTASNNP